MKKKLFFVICAASAAVLVACGGKASGNSQLTEKSYTNVKAAVEIMDKYNSAEINAKEAETRLRSIRNGLDSEKVDDNIKSLNKTAASTDIFLFIDAMDGSGASSTYEIAEDMRKYLED